MAVAASQAIYRTRIEPMRSGFILLLSLVWLWPSAVLAQAEPWIGRWGAPACGRNATEVTLSKTMLDLSTFEMMCRIRGVSKAGDVYTFDTMCQREGEEEGGHKFRASFQARVAGDRLEFINQQPGMEFSPKVFRRCAARR